VRRGDWSSPAFFVEGIVVIATVGAVGRGRGAAVGDGLGVASLGTGGVLAEMGRTSMMKRTIRAGGVFLGASGMGVSEPVTVGALGVTVSLGCFLDLESLGKRKRAERRMGTSSGLTETTTEVACLGSLTARLWLRYRAALIVTSFALRMDFLMKSNNCSSSSGRMWVGIEWISSCTVVGALVNVSQGLSLTGKDWLRRRVRASK